MEIKEKYYLNRKFVTNEGYTVKIIDYINNTKVTILFENGYKTVIQISNLLKGTPKNPFHPNVCKVGYVGMGKHKVSLENKVTKKYKIWNAMLGRCYLDKKVTYKDCSVILEWHNFQNFGDWYDKNYIESFELDKDILIKGNKVYSPKTCCFVPREINVLFTKRQNKRGNYPIGVHFHKKIKKYIALVNKNFNQKHIGSYNTPEEAFEAYKTAKELYIKEIAEKWKDKISNKVYKALINYNVEITD